MRVCGEGVCKEKLFGERRDMTYSHGTVVAGATGYEDQSPAASDPPDVVLQTSQHHCKDTDNVSSGIWTTVQHQAD